MRKNAFGFSKEHPSRQKYRVSKKKHKYIYKKLNHLLHSSVIGTKYTVKKQGFVLGNIILTCFLQQFVSCRLDSTVLLYIIFYKLQWLLNPNFNNVSKLHKISKLHKRKAYIPKSFILKNRRQRAIKNARKFQRKTLSKFTLPHVFWHLLFKNIFFKAFVNSLIHNGKKEKVELLLFKLLCSIKNKTKNQPIFFMNRLFQTLQPVVETFVISKSGRSYPVPKVVTSNRRLAFLVRIMKNVTDKQKKKRCFNSRFLSELVSAGSSTGLVYSKIVEMHRFSFDNRINMRFIRRPRRKRHVFI